MVTDNANDELNALGYNSSAPDFIDMPVDEANATDVAEVTTIVQLKKLIANRRAYYQSNDCISLDPKVLAVFSVEQQMAVAKKMSFHLQELESMIDSTILKVKEKLNGDQ